MIVDNTLIISRHESKLLPLTANARRADIYQEKQVMASRIALAFLSVLVVSPEQYWKGNINLNAISANKLLSRQHWNLDHLRELLG